MEIDKPFTLAVALIGAVLSLALPKKWAIVPLAVSLCMYPSNLLLPPEGMAMTAQRMIGLVLFIRCLASQEIRGVFKWQMVDTVAAIYFILLTASQLIAQAEKGSALVNRAGFFMSAGMPFWCVRMLIVDKASFYALMKGWVWSTPLLMVNAVYFMPLTSGWTPYYILMEHGPMWFGPQNQPRDQRLLFGALYNRAHAPFQQCIMFGWFFALWLAPALMLFFEKRKVFPWILGWLCMPVAIATAISAGPNALAGLSLLLICLFPLRKFWKPVVWTFSILYLVMLVSSERGPMEILAGYGMDPASSWYRVGLKNQVLHYGGMSGHWLAGWGLVPNSLGRFHDLCIHWVGLLVVNGLMGLVGFYGLVAACAWGMWKGKLKAQTTEDELIIWSLLAALIGAMFALMVVSLFAEMQYIFHMFLAVMANSEHLVSRDRVRQVGVVVEMDGKPVLLRYTLKTGQRLGIVTPGQKRQRPGSVAVAQSGAGPFPGAGPGPGAA